MATPTLAAKTLKEIQAELSSGSEELAEVDQMLADPDQNKRIAAMNALLASGNPVFVRRATEAGVLSSDPEMQVAALAAVFENGGPFRVEFTLGDDEKLTHIREWLTKHGGSYDDSTGIGQATFSTLPFDTEIKCWRFPGPGNCAIIPGGGHYSLNDWRNASGSTALGPDGALVGDFLVDYTGVKKSVKIRIPLVD